MNHIYKNLHKQHSLIGSIMEEHKDDLTDSAIEITRGTFKRKVCSSSMGDLEEQLGFSSHHKLGKTMRSCPGVKYFKGSLKGEFVLFFSLPEHDDYFLFFDPDVVFKDEP